MLASKQRGDGKGGMRLLSFFLSLCLLIPGCVRIPPEAPTLSADLGKQISSLEDANISLLHAFFKVKRDEIDQFVQEEWAPLFAKNFFADAAIQRVWAQVVASNDPADRLEFITTLGPKIQRKINAKRLELMTPLDELERTIEQRIRQEYINVRSINSALTALLTSAVKVSENRNRYLEMVGVTQSKVSEVVSKTDEVVEGLLQKATSVEKASKKYLEKIRGLKNDLLLTN